MPTIAEIRAQIQGLDHASDYDIAQAYAKGEGIQMDTALYELGIKRPKTGLGAEWESAKSSYMSGMARIPAAMGSTSAHNYAERMDSQAQFERAQSDAPKSWDEMKFGDNFGKYLRQGVVGSAPYLAEAAGFGVAELATGGAATPAILARLGLRGAVEGVGRGLGERAAVRTFEKETAKYAPEVAAGTITEQEARNLATNAAMRRAEGMERSTMRGVGLTGVTYPSSLGDVLGNQDDQSGSYDLLAAATLAVPYAASNVVGLEGMLAGRGLARGAAGQSIRQGLVRGGKAALETSAGESANEVFQEGMNQFGRMAVDPNEQFFSDAAQGRFKESAIMGGLIGVAGGSANIASTALNKPVDPTGRESTDLLNNQYSDRMAPLQAEAELGNVPGQSRDNLMSVAGRARATGVVGNEATAENVNKAIGVQNLDPKMRAAQQKYYDSLAQEKTGRFVSDPTTGIERELTFGEEAGLFTAEELANMTPAQRNWAISKGAKLPTKEKPLGKLATRHFDDLAAVEAAGLVASEQAKEIRSRWGNSKKDPTAVWAIRKEMMAAIAENKGTSGNANQATKAPLPNVSQEAQSVAGVPEEVAPPASEPPAKPSSKAAVNELPAYKALMTGWLTSTLTPDERAALEVRKGVEVSEADELKDLVKQVKEGKDPTPSSLRMAALELGVSYETVRQRVMSAEAKIAAAAKKAGFELDDARELLGMESNYDIADVGTVSDSAAYDAGLSGVGRSGNNVAYAGASSDDFSTLGDELGQDVNDDFTGSTITTEKQIAGDEKNATRARDDKLAFEAMDASGAVVDPDVELAASENPLVDPRTGEPVTQIDIDDALEVWNEFDSRPIPPQFQREWVLMYLNVADERLTPRMLQGTYNDWLGEVNDYYKQNGQAAAKPERRAKNDAAAPAAPAAEVEKPTATAVAASKIDKEALYAAAWNKLAAENGVTDWANLDDSQRSRLLKATEAEQDAVTNQILTELSSGEDRVNEEAPEPKRERYVALKDESEPASATKTVVKKKTRRAVSRGDNMAQRVDKNEPDYTKATKTTALYERVLFGGPEQTTPLGKLQQDYARKAYNELRRAAGLPVVTDWSKRPFRVFGGPDSNGNMAETIRAKPGVDMARMAKLLGPQLYGNMSDIGNVTIKEVFQNAFDALKGAIQNGQRKDGNILVTVDEDKREITITDDGTGMTPEVINNAFLTLAGTNKETDRASGGLGIAKMLFLFGNESLSLKTVRNGVESTLTTNGQQLMAAFNDPDAAPDINTRKTNEPPGTTVTVKLPAQYTDYDTGAQKDVAFPSLYDALGILKKSPLFENIAVQVTTPGKSFPTDVAVGSAFPVKEYKPVAKAKFAWGNATVLMKPIDKEKDPYKRGSTAVLSNGLFQFDRKITEDPFDAWADPIPYEVYINLEPTVKADSAIYPIALNRKGFSASGDGDLSALLKYLSVLFGNAKNENNVQSFGKLEMFLDGKMSSLELEIPKGSTDAKFRINPEDDVTVEDGRVIVNGQELPPLTKEAMKEMRPNLADFVIDQALVPSDALLIHNNLQTKDGKDFVAEARKALGKEDFDAYINGISSIFQYVRNEVAKVTETGQDYSTAMDVPVGVSFDKEYYGVNIRAPFSAILLNVAKARGTRKEVPHRMVGTMVHEMAHHNERNHSEGGFIPELQTLAVVLAERGVITKAVADMNNLMNKYGNIYDYLENSFGSAKNRGLSLEGEQNTAGSDSVPSGVSGPGGNGRVSQGLRAGNAGGGKNGGGGNRSGSASSPAPKGTGDVSRNGIKFSQSPNRASAEYTSTRHPFPEDPIAPVIEQNEATLSLDLYINGKLVKSISVLPRKLYDLYKGDTRDSLWQKTSSDAYRDAEIELSKLHRAWMETIPLTATEKDFLEALADYRRLTDVWGAAGFPESGREYSQMKYAGEITFGDKFRNKVRESIRNLKDPTNFKLDPTKITSTIAENRTATSRADLNWYRSEYGGQSFDQTLAYLDKQIAKGRELDFFEPLRERVLAAKQQAGVSFSQGKDASFEPTDAALVRNKLKQMFFSGERFDKKVTIVNSFDEIPNTYRKMAISAGLNENTQAFVTPDNHTYMIANNIPAGQELAVFLHEVGGHIGMRGLLGDANFKRLQGLISKWVREGDNGSSEEHHILALKAMLRVESADAQSEEKMSKELALEELVAYFIEEAVNRNINPTALYKVEGPLRDWFRTMWASVKVALRKFGFDRLDKLTPQDIVNLAYGAARLELEGTWHGTAAEFKKFSNEFMGTGEGAQAFGWGTYLAQLRGVGYTYWEMDVRRKTPYDNNTMPEKLPKDTFTDIERSLYTRITKNFGNDTRFRWDYYVTKIAPQNLSPEDMQTLTALNTKLEKHLKWGSGRPDGNLMRVDTSVKDEELFDLDKTFSEQSKQVQTALTEIRDTLEKAEMLDDYEDQKNAPFEEWTGNEFISYSETTELGGIIWRMINDDVIPSSPEVDDAIASGDVKKAISNYLETLGIRGNKFLDATSRDKKYAVAGDIPSLSKLIGTQVYDEDGRARGALKSSNSVQLRSNGVAFEILARFLRVDELFDANGQPFLNAEQIQDIKQEAVHALQTRQTKNIVIFSDKDIFRVASLPGAKQNRIKFSQAATATAGDVSPDSIQAVNATQSTVQSLLSRKLADAANWSQKALNAVVFTHDLVLIGKKLGLKSVDEFDNLMNEKDQIRNRWEERISEIMTRASKLKDKAAAEQFLRDSTIEQKWGYGDKADSKFVGRFNALSASAQDVVKDIFKVGEETYAELRRLGEQEINNEYDSLTQRYPQKAADYAKDRAQALKRHARALPKLEGPYAPLKRFGDYVVVAMSQKYLDAKAANDQKTLDKLVKDKSAVHYSVEFFESAGEAKERREYMSTLFPSAVSSVKQDNYKALDELPWSGIAKVKSEVEDSNESKYKESMSRLATRLYLEMLSDGSARKAELKRRGVSGSADMFRAFAAQGRSNAHFIASMTKTKDIRKQIAAMQNEVRYAKQDSKEQIGRVVNELRARYNQRLDYQETPWTDKALAVTSVHMLLTAPAYFIQNATQTYMVTLPILGGRYGGAAFMELNKAYGQVTKYVGKMGQELNIDDLPISKDEKKMLVDLRDKGKLDITIAAEMGRWASGAADQGVIGRVTDKLRQTASKLETLNRITAALAAYRLSKGDAKYAGEILDQTQGNYSAGNAPRWFHANSAAKLMTQFRKYQLIQISLMGRLVYDAFKNADANERAVARRSLAWLFAQQAFFTGIKGLPIPAALYMIVAALGGDDDKDWERNLRKWIGNDEIATLLIRGVPAWMGLDISGKVGMGNAFSILPYTDIELSRDGYARTMLGLSGAFIGGLGGQLYDGLGKMANGQFYKGTETLMPRGLRDALAAGRIAFDGVTTNRGDTVLSADEINAFDVAMKAVGLPTAKLTEFQEGRNDLYKLGEHFRKRDTSVKDAYANAAKDRDSSEMADIRAEWTELQASKKRWAEEMAQRGFKNKDLLEDLKQQPLSNLLKAPQQKAKREAPWAARQ